MKKSLLLILGGIILIGSGVWFFIAQSSSTVTIDNTNTSTTSSASTNTNSSNTNSSSSTGVSQSELAKNNGKSGSKCWVAVNGTVYDVSNEREWKNGQHTSSDGQAYCGADMSDVIGESPHGTSVLRSLTVVGKLQ